jgi:hypothetical protein
MSSKNLTHFNVGTLITDPNYPEDGVGMIVDIDPTGRRHDLYACSDDIYRIHSFVSGHGVWLDRDYVERECIIIYSNGKTCY